MMKNIINFTQEYLESAYNHQNIDKSQGEYKKIDNNFYFLVIFNNIVTNKVAYKNIFSPYLISSLQNNFLALLTINIDLQGSLKVYKLTKNMLKTFKLLINQQICLQTITIIPIYIIRMLKINLFFKCKHRLLYYKQLKLINMSSICGVQKKQNSYSCQKAIKPFIFKEYPSFNPSQNQSLFSISHIYLHAMAFSSLRVSWGSEVEIKNTKTGLSAKACVLSNENIEQNCILMDSHLKEHLRVDDGNRILVKSFPSIYEQKILSQQQDRLKDRQCDDCSQYAYQKNQCYQLIAKIIGKKLKIQLRIIRGWQGPKLYVLQVVKSIQNIPISSILGYLKKQENYRIYPENGTIEIISPEAQIINIELIQMNKPKNIDTQVIMNLIQDLYNKVNVSKNYATNENTSSDDLVSNLAQQIKQNNDDIPAKPQSFQKSLLTAETQARNAQIQEISSNNVKKTSTQFKPSPDNPKYFQNPQIKSMQMKIESLQKKVLELSACLKIKAGENKAEAQAQQKIFQQKLIMPKIEQSQSSLSKYMQNFQIEESIGSNPKAVNLTVTLKSDSNWLQISPYFIKNKKLIKQKMRVIQSSKKMIFFGLVSKNMSKQSSSWMNTGSVGCFLNNGKLFYNGNQIQRTDQKEQPLANQGDVLQIKLNKLFQQISWIVNGKEKIKVNIPELFEKYNPVKQWTIYSEMFNQGDKINFESQQF